MAPKTRVVIVGAGWSGTQLARKLDGLKHDFDPSTHTITLITPSPYYIHYIAAARLVVTSQGKLEDTALVPLDRLFASKAAGREIKIGRVKSIQAEGQVITLQSGETVDYDVLVLATGSQWSDPMAFPDDKPALLQYLSSWRSKFASAKHVVIAGGGSSGIEFAGEIKEYYPKTDVTIVHSQPLLLNASYPEKFRKSAVARVQSFGVKLILDDRLERVPEGATTATTRNGVKLDADIFLFILGPRSNTSFVSTLDPSVLTSTGQVKILPTLQVPLSNGKRNVFAMGDIIDRDEQRTAYNGNFHVRIVLKNVLALLKDAPLATYPDSKGKGEILFVTLGSRAGFGYVDKLWGLQFGDWVVSKTLSETLLVPQVRRGMGY